MEKLMKNYLILCLVTLAFFATIEAQTDRDRMVFGGFTTISVDVAEINDDVKSLGLTQPQIKSAVESALTDAGLQISANAQQSIFVNIKTIRNDSKSYSYAIILYLDQAVVLQRNIKSKFFGTTWDISSISTTETANIANDVREQVLSLVDEFIVKYNSVNQATQPQKAAEPAPTEEDSGNSVSKIAANLPPTVFLVNKTSRKAYVSIEGRNYVVAPKTTKTIALQNGNAVINARVAGFNAFSPTRISIGQGQGYTMTFSVKAK
jgi:hypothetical protein